LALLFNDGPIDNVLCLSGLLLLTLITGDSIDGGVIEFKMSGSIIKIEKKKKIQQ
jgi:hypothetical protein